MNCFWLSALNPQHLKTSSIWGSPSLNIRIGARTCFGSKVAFSKSKINIRIQSSLVYWGYLHQKGKKKEREEKKQKQNLPQPNTQEKIPKITRKGAKLDWKGKGMSKLKSNLGFAQRGSENKWHHRLMCPQGKQIDCWPLNKAQVIFCFSGGREVRDYSFPCPRWLLSARENILEKGATVHSTHCSWGIGTKTC